MSRSDDNNRPTAAEKMIYRARERLQAVRDQFWRERVEGQVSHKVQRELAIAALQLHDVLHEHRDEDVVSAQWERSPAARLRELLDETVSVEANQPGRTANGQTVERPAIMTVPADDLLTLTEELDDLAKQLGFAASIEQQRPLYDAGKLDPEDYDEPVKEDIHKPK